MSRPHSSVLGWLGRRFSGLVPAGSGPVVVECLAGLLLLVEAVALVLYWHSIPPALEVLLWVQWLAVLVGLRVRGFFLLFGPVLYYDLVRAARRPRQIILRCVYAFLLLFLICWIYLMWVMDRPGGEVSAQQMTVFASSFFYMFISVQFIAVVILTPAFTAGAIAEEKDRKTLEFILATDLRNREIVLSKLASRFANLTLLLLTGVPILSALQFFGGVDPNLTIAGFAATVLTMASLAGLGIFCSVQARKPRDAIALTYLTAAAYLILSTFAYFGTFIAGKAGVVLTPSWISATLPQELAEWFAAGNIIVALVRLVETVGPSGGTVDKVLPELLTGYAVFHGLVAVVMPLWATARLRSVAMSEHESKPRKSRNPTLPTRVLRRPRVGSHPMLWKEIFAEPGMRLHWLGRIAVALVVLGSFAPAFLIFYFTILDPPGGGASSFQHLSEGMNIWVRIVGPVAGSLTLLAVGVRAAGSITGERDKHTLDELLTSPLTSQAILFAKWLGSIVSVRAGWVWLGLIWGAALLTAGMNPLALPPLVAAWVVYAAVFAGIGVWFSMTCSTSFRSTLWTLATILLVSGGHWLIMALFVYAPLAALGGRSRVVNELAEWLADLEVGQTPPVVFGFLAFRLEDFDQPYNRQIFTRIFGCCLWGIVIWGGAAVALYALGSLRFRVLTNRQGLLHPEVRMPRRAAAVKPKPAEEERLDVLPAEEERLDVLPAETANGAAPVVSEKVGEPPG
jgi:ABC-type transport system involved in multi-copper enzyme maturation permease subunit